MRRRKTINKPEKIDSAARITVSEKHKGVPAFIFASDDHIRSGTPECRTDDYVEAIFRKLEFRYKIAEEYNISAILQAGDIGDKNYFVKEGNGWTADILNRFIYLINKYKSDIYCVAGNHDLPGHDIGNLHKSVLGSLVDSGCIKFLQNESRYPNLFELHENKYVYSGSGNVWCEDIDICVYGCSWGEEIPRPKQKSKRNILVIHKMIINNLPLWPGQEAPKAKELLKQYPEYDLIVSGDNHNTFISEYEGRLLVNPGSMMRTKTDQFNHEPCFFLYYPESNTVEKILYNFEKPEKVISKIHVRKKEQRKQRMDKYSHAIKSADFSQLKSFSDNTHAIMSKTGASLRIRDITERFLNHEQPER